MSASAFAVDVIGVVLAGGAGRRMGGAKAGVLLGARPLAAWVADALSEVADEVAIVAKASTALPSFGRSAIAVWREPDQPVHPLAGVVWALERAEGRSVLVCPVDVPFVTAGSLRALAQAPGAIAVAAGQPLLGRFAPTMAPALHEAVIVGRSSRATVAALGATVVELPEDELFNVNTPDDLAAAEALIRSGSVARAVRAGAPPSPR